jgi:hypothetical protein
MNIFQTVYISNVTELFNSQCFSSLAKKASDKNSLIGVTGALLFIEGYFIQVLEGDELIVRDLMASIAADVRHTRLKIIMEVSQEERDFSGLAMGAVSLKRLNSNDIKVISRICRKRSGENLNSTNDIDSLSIILDMFKANKDFLK